MSIHVTISPNEAADRLAIRELVEAYAHCADRRDAKGQMSLFTEDTHFVVYMNAKDPTPSQELHSREALAPSLRGAEQVRRDYALRRTEHDLHTDGRPSHRGSLLPGASRHGRRWKTTIDGRLAPLPRHVREDRRRVVVCGTLALRRLAGGARPLMTATMILNRKEPMRTKLGLLALFLFALVPVDVQTWAGEKYNGDPKDILLQGFHWDSHSGILDPSSGSKKT